mmetsp:Transcript_5396/g.19733  ORF Transcript_5396/g.19733 Transcript_5396/m.19733 type:complete len:164 (+) Transcript_5396:382-873(+)|eukprot:scaffold4437_cov391-Prasinococcus_capsulatus_cf.AAC.4
MAAGLPALPGMKELATSHGLPCYIQQQEVETAALQTETPKHLMHGIKDGDELLVGGVTLRFIHTPGHSPGSMSIVVAGKSKKEYCLISGDTIFPGSCGRLDLPDSDKASMYNSLQNKLSKLDNSLKVYPGHGYSGKSSTIGREKRHGLLQKISLRKWMSMVGG